MQKWEYMCRKIWVREEENNVGLVYYQPTGEDTVRDINSLGQEGWELVSVHDNWAHFKRPIFYLNKED